MLSLCWDPAKKAFVFARLLPVKSLPPGGIRGRQEEGELSFLFASCFKHFFSSTLSPQKKLVSGSNLVGIPEPASSYPFRGSSSNYWGTSSSQPSWFWYPQFSVSDGGLIAAFVGSTSEIHQYFLLSISVLQPLYKQLPMLSSLRWNI